MMWKIRQYTLDYYFYHGIYFLYILKVLLAILAVHMAICENIIQQRCTFILRFAKHGE